MTIKEPIEDRICNMLHKHNVRQSVDEIRKTSVDAEGFVRIYAAELVIVIQPEQEVMHISTLNQVHTFTHSFYEWDNFDVMDFLDLGAIDYVWWLDNLKPALFDIIELLESPASEPTLEEQVEEILEDGSGYLKPCIRYVGPDRVELAYHYTHPDSEPDEVVYPSGIVKRFMEVPKKISETGLKWEYGNRLEQISALLTSAPTAETKQLTRESPENETVIQLRKQVEELQGRLHNFESNLETKKERFDWLAICIDAHDQRIKELRDHRQEMSVEKEILEKEIDVLNYRMQIESPSGS